MELLFIHITDIHLKTEEDYNIMDKKSGSLIGVILKHITDKDSTSVILCLTGDLAQSGKKEEYAYVTSFLKKVVDGVKNRYNDIQLLVVSVPGNHDCNFECSGNAVRSQLLQNKDLNILESEVVETGTKIQEEYMNTLDEWACFYGFPLKRDTILTENKYSNEHLNFILRFHCINTAWCSSNPENKGSIKFDFPDLPDKNEGEIIVVLMHHDEAWFSWSSKERWKEFYQKYADIIFVGHDHTAEFVYKENYNSVSNYFIKGNQFYSSSDHEQSGFNVLKVDTVNNLQYFYTYEWKNSIYKNIINTKAQSFIRNRYANVGIELKKEVLDYIEDIEIDISSKYRESLFLSDIYAFQRLRGDSINGKKGEVVYKNENEILEFIQVKKYVVIEGDKEYGKTALIKRLFKSFYEMKYTPVFIDVSEIKTVEGEEMNKKIAEFYCREYNNLDSEAVLQMSPEKKVCIIDDFEKIHISDKSVKKLLQYLADKFGIVIITRNLRSELTHFLNNIETNAYIKVNFSKLSLTCIKRYGEAKLIDKWLLLSDSEQDIKSVRFEGLRRKKLEQVNTVMKKGYFNRTPVEFLLVLSYLDNAEKMNTDYSRYSYIYDCMIMDKINSIADGDSNEAAMYTTILQQLAFRIYSEKKNPCVEEDYILQVIGDYNQEYTGTRGRIIDTVNVLVTEKIFERKEGKYKFRYNYMFYYFIGKHIKDQLSAEEREVQIKLIFSDLSKEVNYNVALFLAYCFNPEYDILPKILEVGKDLLSDFENFRYEDQTGLISKFDDVIRQKVDKIFIPQNVDIPQLQEDKQLLSDLMGDDEDLSKDIDDEEEEEFEKINTEFIKLLRIIEFLGNILKNYSSKIRKSPRMQMIGLMQESSLKVIGFLCGSFEDLIDNIINVVNEKPPGIEDCHKSKTIFLQETKEFLAQLWISFIEANVSNLSFCLGCDRISKDIDDFNEEHPSNFFKMVKAEYLVRISNEKLPVKEIESCYKGKNKLDRFSQRVLKNNLALYLRNYQFDKKDKQSVCDTLGFDIKKMLLEEQKIQLLEESNRD